MKDKSTPRPLKVTLLSHTENPIGTLFYVWEQSRTNDPLLSPKAYQYLADCAKSDTPLEAYEIQSLGMMDVPYDELLKLGRRVYDTVEMILDESVPVTENIQFVFYIENMSISLREQMVRHRIGTQVGERTGLDIIPEHHQSTWWSQTTRVLPLDKVYEEGRFYVPDTVPEDSEAHDIYHELISQCETVYNKLVELGVPREDARQVMPMAMTHGITWGINLKALIHIFGKRGCWIAQANLWNEMMVGMINEIASKVDPMFRKIVLPPCIKKGKYNTCPIKMINLERIEGRDGMPPCPLFTFFQSDDAINEQYKEGSAWTIDVERAGSDPEYDTRDIRNWNGPEKEHEMLDRLIPKFEGLWGFDPVTGEPNNAI